MELNIPWYTLLSCTCLINEHVYCVQKNLWIFEWNLWRVVRGRLLFIVIHIALYLIVISKVNSHRAVSPAWRQKPLIFLHYENFDQGTSVCPPKPRQSIHFYVYHSNAPGPHPRIARAPYSCALPQAADLSWLMSRWATVFKKALWWMVRDLLGLIGSLSCQHDNV